jgi:hypothetical protein
MGRASALVSRLEEQLAGECNAARVAGECQVRSIEDGISGRQHVANAG